MIRQLFERSRRPRAQVLAGCAVALVTMSSTTRSDAVVIPIRTPTPTSTPTSTPTRTPTHSPTFTPTSTPTRTPTNTPTSTPTTTPTSTFTPVRSPTPTPEPPGIRIDDLSVIEGDVDHVAVFTVRVTGTRLQTVRVRATTKDGTARAGEDYVATSVDLTFPPLTEVQTVAVPILGDRLREANETFFVKLSKAIGAPISDDQAIGVILNDDSVSVGIAELVPIESRAEPGKRSSLTLRWLHPERWRALRTVDLRLIDEEGPVLWVRFDEAADTLSLCDKDGVCGDGRKPGTDDVIANADAVLHLAQSAVFGSGATGPSVDLVFAFTLERAAAGRRLRVEAAAIEDDGTEQDFSDVGLVEVRDGGNDGCAITTRPHGTAWHLIVPLSLFALLARSTRRPNEGSYTKEEKMRIRCKTGLALIVTLTAVVVSGCGSDDDGGGNNPTVISASGDVSAAVDTFRDLLGSPNNGGTPGSQPSGRREINWDGVPDELSSPHFLPPDFFNGDAAPRARGAFFDTPGDGVQVSADSDNPDAAAVRFGNINPSYTDLFETFSPERLFSPIGSNVVDMTFFVPGTDVPAVVTGFGAVYTDVDLEESSFEFFDANGDSLGRFAVPTNPGGLSFLGVVFPDAVVARVRIAYGTDALGPDQSDEVDVAVMDDFLYGEPVAIAP